MLSTIYSSAARARRWFYTPARQRRLSRPVISIGNLAAGGRAKTPMAGLTARLLIDAGERPSILTRGYAREIQTDAPVIVRDADAVRAGLRESGDEPLMLAEQLPGAIVVVHADRARAGLEAEQLGATCHILDDGFQHLQLARDIEILMIDGEDLQDSPYPSGRLREAVDAIQHAHAIVALGVNAHKRANTVKAVSSFPGIAVFAAAREVEAPSVSERLTGAYVVSGLSDNAQFVEAVRGAGWKIDGERGFRDHHRYSSADAEQIHAAAAAAGARFILTTEKDAVRLRDVWRGDMVIRAARLELVFDEAARYRAWLIDRLTQARERAESTARRRAEDGARAS